MRPRAPMLKQPSISFIDRTSLAYASAIDLRGLIELDIGHPHECLKSFEQALRLRTNILSEDDPFLAASFVNLGLAFTEIGELAKARGLSSEIN